MFDAFRHHHLAIGSYSNDWDKMWESWVRKAVDIDEAIRRRDRAQAYWQRYRSRQSKSAANQK
jgi:hypothetical protein